MIDLWQRLEGESAGWLTIHFLSLIYLFHHFFIFYLLSPDSSLFSLFSNPISSLFHSSLVIYFSNTLSKTTLLLSPLSPSLSTTLSLSSHFSSHLHAPVIHFSVALSRSLFQFPLSSPLLSALSSFFLFVSTLLSPLSSHLHSSLLNYLSNTLWKALFQLPQINSTEQYSPIL